ncbi:unnamed protein product [Rotaria socialis]|uniref:Uncharacterized protein n=1 Tax=Rotaria socialis TaxID=392032 RepID=A0A821YKE1_9BILA|nr:unnamed protein product [Rotaria socialis]
MLYREEDIFRLDQHCSTIRNAVLYTIQEHKIKTADIGSTSTTTQFIGCALNGIVKMTSKIVFNTNIYQGIEVKQEANQSDLDDGIARGNDALTLLENRSTYPLFIH